MSVSHLDAKPILITGASRGLGAALAVELSARAHIIAVARTTGGLEELDDRIQAADGSATLAPMDVTDAGAMAHLCRSVFDRWGGLSIWVHSAVHAPPLAPADHIDAKDLAKTLALNVTATATLIPMIAPLLGAQGQAVFFADPHADEKFFGAYAASKQAQIALAQAWAAETARNGPKVHILEPAPMPTAVRARFFPGEDTASLTVTRSEAARLAAKF
ncbi:Oxidoreductase, short-chain dehydrogenase/reductase family [Candidatus Rhodobacter oscarellae]|uniref:Oxidoreductase, short-chain dehydrogenase/reductase family n=1 Tax=Candidatus Rhodobacter oscarellae TaxID=1675527 RepID=A0A0J9E5T3_9RHOB|nr:SDR family oxidoreductase [Candidatus Rhodobacter lobularis]KMW57154.1 Oxidoreductase, short-chain dehydrogenase/reductase family [Candidatus Rhodobacter lobularis]